MRILLYLIAAVALGLAVTLVPLVTLAEIRADSKPNLLVAIPRQLEFFETPNHLSAPQYSSGDLNVLAFSFIAASIVYVIFRRRPTRQEYPTD
jgi:hypothetical protein